MDFQTHDSQSFHATKPPPIERHVHEMDFAPPPGDRNGATRIANFEGAPYRFEMPNQWSVTHDSDALTSGYRWTAKAPATKDTELSINSIGINLPPDSANNLNQLLQKTPPGTILYDSAWDQNSRYQGSPEKQNQIADTVRKLSSVLGRSQLGDNQFTVEPGYEPTFKLDRLSVQSIDGKPAISISGTFPIDGKPARYLSASLVPFETGKGTGVTRITFQGTNPIEYNANLRQYNESLKTLKWK